MLGFQEELWQAEVDRLRKYRYDQLPLSDDGLLIGANSGLTQDEIISKDASVVIALGLADDGLVDILRRHQYKALPLPDPALLLLARQALEEPTLIEEECISRDDVIHY